MIFQSYNANQELQNKQMVIKTQIQLVLGYSICPKGW